MAGRRTIDRKGQRGEFEEEPVKVEAEEVEEDDDDDEEDEETARKRMPGKAVSSFDGSVKSAESGCSLESTPLI